MNIFQKFFAQAVFGVDLSTVPPPVHTQIANHPGKPSEEDLDRSRPMGKCPCGGARYMCKGSLTEAACSECGLTVILVLENFPECTEIEKVREQQIYL